MNKRKKILKRITSLLLALTLIIMGAGGVTGGRVNAASMATGTQIFGEPGIDVFGDGRQATFTVKFADGVNAYCVEYHSPINDLSTYVQMTNPYVKLTLDQRKQLAYALSFGFMPASPEITSKEDKARYVMTQTLIWCITEGHWGNRQMMEKARERMAGAMYNFHSVDVGFSRDYFNDLWSRMELALNSTLPSFADRYEKTAPTVTMQWSEERGRYQTTLTDTNGVLSSFSLSSLNTATTGCGVSGNSVTVYSTVPVNGTLPVFEFTPVPGSYAAKNGDTSVIYWGNANHDQTVVTPKVLNPDPIKAFIKLATEKGDLRIKKVSDDGGQPLNDVVFDIYSDAGCSELVATVKTGNVNGADGAAEVTGLNVGQTYYVKERAAAANHRPYEGVEPVTIKSGTTEITIVNERVPVSVTLIKTERGTAKPVSGAVYSLYAREDIKAAAGNRVLFHAGELVADFPATGNDGRAVLENLYIGKYFVKEKTAPSSGIYALDTTEYEADASPSESGSFTAGAVINFTVRVSEPTNPGFIKIVKTAERTNEPLSGAQFGIYSDAECTQLVQKLTTGADGTAVSGSLTAGKYYVKELAAPDGYVKSAEVKEGMVTPAVTTDLSFKNREITVLISKTSVTGDCPEVPGATLVIKDSDGNVIEQWVSEGTPHRMEKLPAGTYTLTELRTPFGYQAAETVEFTVEEKNDIQKVTMVDAETYGRVIIDKTDMETGMPLAGVEFTIYSLGVTGAAESADEDAVLNPVEVLVTDENGHAESKLLPIGTYGTEGFTSYIQYMMKETKALPGYVLDETEYDIEFTYVDDKTPVIDKTYMVGNDEAYGRVIIDKADEETGESLAGVEFTIYSIDLEDEDAVLNPVEVLVTDENGHAQSKLLPIGTFGVNGLEETKEYVLKETKALPGYVLDGTEHKVVFDYKNDRVSVIESVLKLENDFTKVEFSKTSVTGDCPEIPGATLVIKDMDGSVIEQWVSEGEPHRMDRLPAGTYTLTELRTPFGYQAAETVEFTVEETGDIQKVTMIDAEIYGKVIIDKTDSKTGKALAGVEFTVSVAEDVLDAEGNVVIKAGTVVDTLVTDKKGHAESKLLPIGTYGTEGFKSYIKYVLKESKALGGYVLDETEYDIEFTYVDDKTPVINKSFELKNKPIEREPDKPKLMPPPTGDDVTHLVFLVGLMLISAAVGLFYGGRKYKNRPAR